MNPPDPSPPAPYRAGWRAPWRGQWAGFHDGHTRLSHLARRIEAELREQYDTTTARGARLVRRAARLEALSEMTIATIGIDAKSTRRAATALTRAADGQIAQLEKLGLRKEPRPPTVLELLAKAENGR